MTLTEAWAMFFEPENLKPVEEPNDLYFEVYYESTDREKKKTRINLIRQCKSRYFFSFIIFY